MKHKHSVITSETRSRSWSPRGSAHLSEVREANSGRSLSRVLSPHAHEDAELAEEEEADGEEAEEEEVEEKEAAAEVAEAQNRMALRQLVSRDVSDVR